MGPDKDKAETHHSMEHVLVNITASYCLIEDRIRLRGKTQQNALVEIWLSMFFETLDKKMKPVIESTVGIRGTDD